MRFIKPLVAAVFVVLWSASTTVLAEKGGKHGKGKSEAQVEQGHGKAQSPDDGVRVEFRFGEQDRRVVRDYYGGQAKGGKCPPGLAKKGNSCLPPGQAKKWAMGRPLAHDVGYHDLPYELMRRMPPPPPGHRYVQVAGDILLIAVGTSIVVDAIQDILR